MIMVDDQGLQFGMNGRNRDGCLSASFSGRVTVKVVPEPAALVTSIVPPIKSTIFLVIAIPRPVPSILSVFDVWERSKGVNRCGRNSWSMPMPLSLKTKRKCPYPVGASVNCLISSLSFPPRGVNLIELLRILVKIC